MGDRDHTELVLIELELAEEGGYVVTFPQLPGCVSEGDTFEDALRNAADALHGWLAAAATSGFDVAAAVGVPRG